MGLEIVILAAGLGKRMKSKLPKVLHEIRGRSLLEHVIDKANLLDDVQQIILVVGHGEELVRERLGADYTYVRQDKQLGTGHALNQAVGFLGKDADTVLVLCGDTPLLAGDTLRNLVQIHRQGAAATVLTAIMDDPTGYGRIIRGKNGNVSAIIEEQDADAAVRQIKEINTGTYCFSRSDLIQALSGLKTENAQGEYYLTDVISIFRDAEKPIRAFTLTDPQEAMGVNNRRQLAEAARILNYQVLNRLMDEGVTIIDPASTFIDERVKIGMDSVIFPFTFIEGNTITGDDCQLGPGTRIRDSQLGNGVVVEQSVVLGSVIGDNCSIGPFSYLRPGNELAAKVKIGDFTEIKKSVIGEGSKIPHLSYIGDAVIGREVNIGAGTITCNYDGVHKCQTVLEDNVFVASNTNFVAPVVISADSFIGAGSTITKDVPLGALGVARGKQVNYPVYSKRKKSTENKK